MAEKIVRVFISSTFEDLQEERESVKNAILELNHGFHRCQIAMLPIDMKTGARPNPPKEECLSEVSNTQVLLGILGMRYGHVDKDTGKSITELEYDKACELGLPALMYFRRGKIDPQWMDTDADLIAKRNAFWQKVERTHQRDTFKTTEGLRGNVLRDLGATVFERYAEPYQPVAEAAETPPPAQPDQDVGAPVPEKTGNGQTRVSELLKSIGHTVGNLKRINREQRRRLYLLAASMFYDTELSGVLGTHEIHVIYSERKKFLPIGRELAFLAKSIFGDRYATKPGWFWIRDLPSKPLLKHLRWLCANESDQETRVGCLLLLRNFWSHATEDVVCANIHDVAEKVCLGALGILKDLGTLRCIDVVEAAEKHEADVVRKAAKAARFNVLRRYDPIKAASIIGELGDPESKIAAAEMTTAMEVMGIPELKDLTKAENEDLRQFATRELARRGELNDEQYKELTNSDDPELRYLGYNWLIDKGEDVDADEIQRAWAKHKRTGILGLYLSRTDLQDKLITRVLAKCPASKLKNLVSWAGPKGRLAYFVLGQRAPDDMKDQIRDDIRNRFERIKDETIAKDFSELMGTPNSQHLLTAPGASGQAVEDSFRTNWQARWKDLDDFIVGQFTVFALRILSQCAHKMDIEFGKKFIRSENASVRNAAAELLLRLSEEVQPSLFVDIALKETGNVKLQSAEKALSTTSQMDVVETFLNSNDAALVKLVLTTKLKQKRPLAMPKVQELLHNENTQIREVVVAYVMKAFRRQKVEKVLDEYLASATYYYNVVAWLDRILYAPRSFKRMFKGHLAKNLAS